MRVINSGTNPSVPYIIRKVRPLAKTALCVHIISHVILYGAYSAAVKNVLDRSIGTSTPFSTYRGHQMHHTLRYGKHDLWKVIVYGEVSEAEKATFRYVAERNAVNDGYERSEVIFLKDLSELEASL